jgi:hypothetical protein
VGGARFVRLNSTTVWTDQPDDIILMDPKFWAGYAGYQQLLLFTSHAVSAPPAGIIPYDSCNVDCVFMYYESCELRGPTSVVGPTLVLLSPSKISKLLPVGDMSNDHGAARNVFELLRLRATSVGITVTTNCDKLSLVTAG